MFYKDWYILPASMPNLKARSFFRCAMVKTGKGDDVTVLKRNIRHFLFKYVKIILGE